MSESLFSDLQPLCQSETQPLVIAGPCSAESEDQVLATARELSAVGVTVFRAGLWKPRTSPGSFAGVGERGLSWLQRVKRETGMAIATEVATAQHVAAALDAGIDMLWLGARTTANPFATQEIADALASHHEVGVLVKNPVNPDVELWLGALQRLYNAGMRRLGAVHRGFDTYGMGRRLYRNEPHWHIALELMRRCPTLPLLHDPSHLGGKRTLVATLAQQAMDMGFDGLMIEAHCNPDCALSDAAQQITPSALRDLLQGLIIRRPGESTESLTALRELIDNCDRDLLEALAKRMQVSRESGQFKKSHKLQVVQTARFDAMLRDRLMQASELGLNPDFINKVMQAIHEESVRQQLDL